MADVTIDQKELKKLFKNLQQLTPKMQRGILNLATKAGAKTIEDSAKQNAPKRTGRLAKAIHTRRKSVRKKKRDGDNPKDAVYEVGVKLDGTAWYATMIEFGTVKQPAQPYMRPTFENTGDTALNGMKSYLKRRVERAIKQGLIR